MFIKFCIGIYNFFYKLITRCRIIYYLYYLQKYKKKRAMKKLKCNFEPVSMDSNIISLISYPFIMGWKSVESIFVYIVTVFISDQYVFLLANFNLTTVLMTFILLLICTFLPLFSKYALSLNLLMIPSLTIYTLRAAIFSLIFFQLNRIAWANIDNNFNSLFESISCEKQIIANTKDYLINIKNVSDGKGGYLSEIRYMNQVVLKFYREFVYLMYLKANIKNVVKKKFQDMIKILTEIDTSFLSYFGIKGLLDKFLKWIANLVKQLSTLICNLFCSFCFFFEFTSTPHSLAGKALEKVVNSIVTAALDELKSEFTIKGKAGSIIYMVLFRNFKSYKNSYLTEDFCEYDKQKQRDGNESLLPLYLFEYGIYTKLYSSTLVNSEITARNYRLMLNVMFTLNLIVVFTIDIACYELCIFCQFSMNELAHDLQTDPTIESSSRNSGHLQMLLRDFNVEKLRNAITSCAPTPSPLDTQLYLKCLYVLIFIFFISILEPYIKRTKICVCSRLFPELVHQRSIWLYNRIILYRIIMKVIVQTNPAMNPLIQSRFGDTNVLELNEDNPELDMGKGFKKVWNIFKSFLSKFWFIRIFKPKKACCKCSNEFNDEKNQYIHCPNWNCPNFYCLNCFESLRRRCIKCNVEVRLIDDEQSMESDSSGEVFD
ncbi:DC-STAMP-like protein [Blomia tropicalis]|nr:DC-STAMP-like protein [Blomia tropicalis]